jgi:exodeoxyribonuclease VII large subunit
VRPNPFELLGSPLARSAPGVTREKPISVSDLATETRVLVESALQPVWVRGEICDFKRYRSGHWYFSLRDNSAQIRCVVWASDQRGIPASPDDGMQVIVFGQMTVYPARAELQLRIRRIEAVGDGLWRKAMEQTLAKLRSEGLLEEGRKRPIPQFPKRVAIVTSADGAAIRDIVAVMRNRNAGIQLVLCQARVQGDGAALEIAAALRRVAKWALADVVIVGRGGGSKEDLWAFNDERVARAVVECPVPVISAVGHEVDITVCDAVADLRASTPSAAAAAACSARVEIEKAFALARHHLSDAITSRVQGGRNELERLNRCIAQTVEGIVASRKSLLAGTAGRLNALSPLATLSRGYAVARDSNGKALTSTRQFRAGLSFELLLHDGKVGADTTDVEEA